MASLSHQGEIFALHILASTDVLKNILIIYFVNKLEFNMRSSFNCCRSKKKMLFSSIDYEKLKNI